MAILKLPQGLRRMIDDRRLDRAARKAFRRFGLTPRQARISSRNLRRILISQPIVDKGNKIR